MDPLKIPVEVPQGAEALALLERFAQAVEGTGRAAESAGDKAEEGASAWRRAADTFNEVREAVGALIEGINGAVERLAASASEAERLSRAQRQLGLDFDAAAAGAGGYVDSLEVATAASTLAERGIRLQQDELSALTRVAQNYARTTGKEFSEAMEMVTEVVTEGGEEMGKFDIVLFRVADTARFTADDRLSALVERASQIAPAARTAEESMRAFEGALRDAERTFSQGFVESLASFQTGTADAATKVRELKDEITAVGATVGEVVGRAGSGIMILVGGLIAGLGSVVGVLRAAGAGVDALINRRDVGAAASSAFRDTMTTGFMGDVVQMIRARIDALEDIDRERTSMAAPSTGDTAGARARNVAARSQTTGGGGGGSSQARGADMTFSQDEATYGEAGVADRAREQANRGLDDDIRGITRVSREDAARLDVPEDPADAERRRLQAIDARNARANARQPGGTVGDMLDARESARQRRELEQRVDAMQSYTDRMRDLHGERADAARLEAEAVTMGFDSMGQAMAKHVLAFALGREGVGEALQGMLADTLTSIGQEAIVKGAMQFAEGAAMLAGIYTAPLAPGYFAAGAAFMGVGALAAAAGAALTPGSSTPSASGGGAAPSSAPRSDRMLGASPGNDSAGPAVVNHYYAPVIGGREASAAQVGTRMERFTDAAGRRQQRDRRAA